MRDLILSRGLAGYFGGVMTGGASGVRTYPSVRPARFKAFIKKLKAYGRTVRAHLPRPPARNDSVQVVEANSQILELTQNTFMKEAGGAWGVERTGYYWVDGGIR
jgi:hypothetical protein